MTHWLRWFLIAGLLLRVAAGSAWAMPVVIAPSGTAAMDAHAAHAVMPCHALPVDASPADTPTPDAPQPAGPHASGVHCALCFPATGTTLVLPFPSGGYSQPVAPRSEISRWQRIPELRPPI